MNPMGRGSGFVKFLVVPACFALVGFFLVGPYLGRSPKLSKMVREKAAQFVPGATEAPTIPPPSSTEDQTEKPSTPEVSVDVRPLPNETPTETPRRRRRHSSD